MYAFGVVIRLYLEKRQSNFHAHPVENLLFGVVKNAESLEDLINAPNAGL